MKEAQHKTETATETQNKPRRRRNRNRNRSQSQGNQNKSQTQQAAHSSPKQNAGKPSGNRRHGNRKTDGQSQPAAKANNPAKAALSQKEVSELLLPSAAALHEFEYAVEGGAERLLEMAKKEQAHRHAWENHALRSQIKSQRLGLLFGTLVMLFALYVVNSLATSGQEFLAEIIAITVFGVMGIVVLGNLFSKKSKGFEREV